MGDKPPTKDELEDMLSKLSMNRHVSALEPTNYSGQSTENATDWLTRFENYSKLNGLDNAKKIITFQLLLKGASSCWFNCLTDAEKKDYDVIVKKFKDTFMSSSKNLINTLRLETRKLQPSESCEAYINEVLNISNQIGLSEKEISQTLLRGLPGSMRAHIIAFNPTTMDDTIQRIYLAEATIKIQQKEDVSVIDNGSNEQITAIAQAMQTMNEHIHRISDTQESERQTL